MTGFIKMIGRKQDFLYPMAVNTPSQPLLGNPEKVFDIACLTVLFQP